jgi:hypothetical protein
MFLDVEQQINVVRLVVVFMRFRCTVTLLKRCFFVGKGVASLMGNLVSASAKKKIPFFFLLSVR